MAPKTVYLPGIGLCGIMDFQYKEPGKISVDTSELALNDIQFDNLNYSHCY